MKTFSSYFELYSQVFTYFLLFLLLYITLLVVKGYFSSYKAEVFFLHLGFRL